MKKETERVYIDYWLELKPYDTHSNTDLYFLRLSNKVYAILSEKPNSLNIETFLDTDEIKILSCFITSYFEDLISETEIWNTFVRSHHELYGKYLPFYNLDEYYPTEINHQDIQFLIWYFLNTRENDDYFQSLNNSTFAIATDIMAVFEQEWETAPANNKLKSCYEIGDNETEYYTAREFISTILFRTYLFYPDTGFELQEQEQELLAEKGVDPNLMHYLNSNHDKTVHNVYTRLLSLKGKDWASKILAPKAPISKDFANIKGRVDGLFNYKEQDKKDILLEHFPSNKSFKLTKKSFDDSHLLQQIDRVIHIGLASWRDEWWFSGNYFLPAVDGNLASHEVAKLSSATDVAFLEDNERVTAFLLAQFKVFKEFNNGQQIVFLPTKKVNDFIRSFIEYHNSNLSMTERKRVKAKQKAQASAALSLFDSPQVQSDFEDSALVFFNPERGIEVATNINSAFPAQYNPYFSADLSDEHLNKMLFNENISPGLCQYCIENHKSQLPFFKEGEGKFYLQDLDFLLRYWKKNKYHPKPIISISEKVRSKH